MFRHLDRTWYVGQRDDVPGNGLHYRSRLWLLSTDKGGSLKDGSAFKDRDGQPLIDTDGATDITMPFAGLLGTDSLFLAFAATQVTGSGQFGVIPNYFKRHADRSAIGNHGVFWK
jgi:hypothetical protein